MSSLTNVVNAMSTENENSTLGWDVVVNYSAKELNKLLKARHEQGGEGQLKNISVQLPKHDDEDIRYVAYDFILGAPLIQFTSNGIDPSCSVNIPITGGTVKGKNGKIFNIDPDVYTLLVSAIPLASANGTVDAIRDPKHSSQPFTFSSTSTTGIVTLNLGTAADAITVELQIAPEAPSGTEHVFLTGDRKEILKNILTDDKVILGSRGIVFDDKKGTLGNKVLLKMNQGSKDSQLDDMKRIWGNKVLLKGSTDFLLDDKKGNLGSTGPKHVFLIDDEMGNLAQKIKIQLRDPHIGGKITWDLGHINNVSSANNSLVPKSFRFAIYAPENKAETVLSLFIQTDDIQHGRIIELQAGWIDQWADKYKVSPIASPYTASVIFNNRLIISLMNKSAQMTFKKSPDQPTEGGLKFIVLTHQRYRIEGKNERFWGSSENRSRVDDDLDDESKALRITVGQNGDPNRAPSAQLDWSFTSSVSWNQVSVSMGRGGNNTMMEYGSVKVENRLQKTKSVDDSDLPNYLLHLDVKIVSSDWNTPVIEADKHEWWQFFTGAREYTSFVKNALPSSLPSPKVEMVNFKFFMTTNLLLPGSKVIKFENGGVRFPKDLYVVGRVAENIPPSSPLPPKNESSTPRSESIIISSKKKGPNTVFL